MSQTFLLQPGKTALGDIAKIYRGDLPCRLPGEAREAVDAAAALVAAAASGDDGVYGINTGFGKLAQTRIAPEETAKLQRIAKEKNIQAALKEINAMDEVFEKTVLIRVEK